MMNTIREFTLNVSLGISLSDDKILMAASSERARSKVEPYLDFIRIILGRSGKTLVYFPELISSITPAIADYAFPGVDLSGTIASVNDRVFSSLQPKGDEVRLVRHGDRGLKFFVINLEDVEKSVLDYSFHLQTYDDDSSSNVMFSISPDKHPSIFHGYCQKINVDLYEDRIPDSSIPFVDDEEPDSLSSPSSLEFSLPITMMEETTSDLITYEREVDLGLNPQAEKIISELEAIMTKYNLSPHDLESLLGSRVELSDLHITKTGRIFLPAFNNRELDLDVKSKALYILYLKHPEGIGYKYLQDYKKELIAIYCSISNRGELSDLVSTVESLVDPMNTDPVSISVARIKRAFRDIMADNIAQNYYVKGPQGKPKKIDLDRSRVKFV